MKKSDKAYIEGMLEQLSSEYDLNFCLYGETIGIKDSDTGAIHPIVSGSVDRLKGCVDSLDFSAFHLPYFLNNDLYKKCHVEKIKSNSKLHQNKGMSR